MKQLRSLTLRNKSSSKLIFLVISVVASFAVSGSLFAEWVLGKAPCFLCLVQRGIHCLLLPIALIGCIAPRLRSTMRIACLSILLISAIVGSYHSLVQFGVLPDQCKTTTVVTDEASFKTLLLKRGENKPCAEPDWGTSYARVPLINAFISILLFAYVKIKVKSILDQSGLIFDK